MISFLVALLSLGVAVRGSYLQKKSTNEEQYNLARVMVLFSLVLTLTAFVLRSYNV
jgi:hypothetical protein